MLESIINLVSSGAVDSHTPQTAVAAVLVCRDDRAV
ncbi:small predicted membrane protein [Escherichia coli]|uniref:Small predicted membrane protein n=1 Tax=Escherichia coli TaxID=562 RepID=A0A484Y7P3_ECOLX|nr:small predicted membrane protein [Escherichia coli]